MAGKTLDRGLKREGIPRGISSQKGFSLVELLISIVILSYISLSIAQLFTLSVWSEHASRKRTELLFIGQNKMETLVNTSTTNPVTGPSVALYDSPCGGNQPWLESCFSSFDANHKDPTTLADARGVGYYMVWEVFNVSAGSNARLIHLYIVPYPKLIQFVRPVELADLHQ